MSRIRRTKEESIRCIVSTAEGLFRRYGFGKTTVADIAGELGMSSANVYKFFSSKDAIVESCLNRALACLVDKVNEILGKDIPVGVRFEQVVLTIHRHHRDLLRNEEQTFKMVTTARDENWDCIQAHDRFMEDIFRRLLEEGRRRGEMEFSRTSSTVRVLRDSLLSALYPYLRYDFSPEEGEKRVLAHVRFVLRALLPQAKK